MFHSVFAAAAAALLVSCSTAFKLDKFDDQELEALFADLPPAGTKETSSGSGYSTTSFKEIGFAQTSCESSADSAMFEDYVEAYVEAVTNVVKKSCTPLVNNLERLKEDMEEFAFAWAEATASASATCESFSRGGGRTRGCAVGESFARAYEFSFASAHAKAAAEAFGTFCSCTDADAWDFAEADIFVELYATATAAAKAIACSEGNGRSSADAYISCYAETLVDVYAASAAEASFKAGCTDTKSQAKALAKVAARERPTESCIETKTQSGSGKATTKGFTETETKVRGDN